MKADYVRGKEGNYHARTSLGRRRYCSLSPEFPLGKMGKEEGNEEKVAAEGQLLIGTLCQTSYDANEKIYSQARISAIRISANPR